MRLHEFLDEHIASCFLLRDVVWQGMSQGRGQLLRMIKSLETVSRLRIGIPMGMRPKKGRKCNYPGRQSGKTFLVLRRVHEEAGSGSSYSE